MSETHPLHAAQRQRAAKRSKPGSAGERIEAIAFDLATGSRVVSPEEVADAIAAHRIEVLTEAAEIAEQGATCGTDCGCHLAPDTARGAGARIRAAVALTIQEG
jgi:hypothetical protein